MLVGGLGVEEWVGAARVGEREGEGAGEGAGGWHLKGVGDDG